MVIKYSRLATGDTAEYLSWAKSALPLPFLKNQIPLVAIDLKDEFASSASDDLNYAVVVDCGSSGTRAHLFSWRLDPIYNPIDYVRNPSNGEPLQEHITPGLSSLKDEPHKASDYMEPLMKFISDIIPLNKHPVTPIYFLATAGLRLLEESTQRQILSDITKDLSAKYTFPNIKSQVISGQYEGVYSWLSINANRKLYNNTLNSRSYGMIEMGGASIQVTYELSPEIEASTRNKLKSPEALSVFKDQQVSINLGPNGPIKLFATTFLGLGVNSAREAAIDILIKDFMNSTGYIHEHDHIPNLSLHDPCLAIDSSETAHRPLQLLTNPRQQIGLSIKEREKTFMVNLEGSGDFFDCMNLLDRVLKTVKNEKLNCHFDKPCSMQLLGADFIPYEHYEFVGLSEMFFTTNEMMHLAGRYNRSKVLHETQKICNTAHNKLMEVYHASGVTREDRILYECFKASWLLTILHGAGLRMPDEYDKFDTVDRLGGKEMDWTIGAITSEVALSQGKHGSL